MRSLKQKITKITTSKINKHNSEILFVFSTYFNDKNVIARIFEITWTILERKYLSGI